MQKFGLNHYIICPLTASELQGNVITINNMSAVEYLKFDEVNSKEFILLLNNQKIREHLIEHELFDAASVKAWIIAKLKVDSTAGCIVRAIIFDSQLGGWCGIQLEDEKYEIAIVIDSKFWGLGKKIFYDMMGWAKALGHDKIFIHFLHTRPEYKFLRRISTKVYESEILGSKFTTYELAVI